MQGCMEGVGVVVGVEFISASGTLEELCW